MIMLKIKAKAKDLGIEPGKMKKAELIHAIQEAEGCATCFGKVEGQCVYADCCFMKDCRKLSLN